MILSFDSSCQAHLHLVEAVLELGGLVGRIDVDQDQTSFGSSKLGQVPSKFKFDPLSQNTNKYKK